MINTAASRECNTALQSISVGKETIHIFELFAYINQFLSRTNDRLGKSTHLTMGLSCSTKLLDLGILNTILETHFFTRCAPGLFVDIFTTCSLGKFFILILNQDTGRVGLVGMSRPALKHTELSIVLR